MQRLARHASSVLRRVGASTSFPLAPAMRLGAADARLAQAGGMGMGNPGAACGYVTKATTTIVGLDVAENPRKTLLELYTRTLQELQAFPPEAHYRAEVERKTAARMKVVMDPRAEKKDPDYTWMNLQLNLLNLLDKGFMVEDKMLILEPELSQPDMFPFGRFIQFIQSTKPSLPEKKEMSMQKIKKVFQKVVGRSMTPEKKEKWKQMTPEEWKQEKQKEMPKLVEDMSLALKQEQEQAMQRTKKFQAFCEEELGRSVPPEERQKLVEDSVLALASGKAVLPETEFVAEMLINTPYGPVECLIYDLLACKEPIMSKPDAEKKFGELPFLDDDKVMFTPYFPEREKIVDENGVCVKRKREHIPSFLQNEEFIELAQDELVLIPKMLEMKPWEVEKDHMMKMVDKNRLKGVTTEDLLAPAGFEDLKKWTKTV